MFGARRLGPVAAGSRPGLNPSGVVDELAPGSIVSGRFQLGNLLGRGGMASVWQARHLALEIDVAIKFLESKWSDSDVMRARFIREATAIARIRSPHVVQVLDHGFTESRRGFIVMELLQGEDLGKRLQRTQRLGLSETMLLVAQACRGLGKAHAASVIHRDIKPENLFLTTEDDEFLVKLLDFGVAKATGGMDGASQTDTGQIVGTPLYMSPEQLLGRFIDARCDLYSLATVAYRCLTGRLPFTAKHVGELLLAISSKTPPVPSAIDPSLPPALDAWFASMFAKDPSARCCQTVGEFAATFEAACRAAAANAAVVGGEPESAPSVDAATLPGQADASMAAVRDGAIDDTASLLLGTSARDAQHRGRARRAVLVSLVAVGSASLGIWTRWPSSNEGVEAVALETASAPQMPAPPARMRFWITATPPGASLYLDGELLPSNPFSGTHPRDSGVHHLRVEAPDHLPLERVVSLDQDLRLELSLAPAAGSVSDGPTLERPAHPPGARPARQRASNVEGKPRSKHRRDPLARPEGEAPGNKPRNRPLELDRSSPWQVP